MRKEFFVLETGLLTNEAIASLEKHPKTLYFKNETTLEIPDTKALVCLYENYTEARLGAQEFLSIEGSNSHYATIYTMIVRDKEQKEIKENGAILLHGDKKVNKNETLYFAYRYKDIIEEINQEPKPKVYVLTIDNSETITVELYKDYKAAHKRLAKIIKETDIYEDDIVEKEKDYFSVFEEGNYNENHFTARITEQEIL